MHIHLLKIIENGIRENYYVDENYESGYNFASDTGKKRSREEFEA